jgi:hypothetical protein
MKTKLVDTIANNEEDVRLRIFDGDLDVSEACAELIRMERARADALECQLVAERGKSMVLHYELQRYMPASEIAKLA